MEPIRHIDDQRASRLVTAVAEVHPLPVSDAARALRGASLQGAPALSGLAEPSWMWAPREELPSIGEDWSFVGWGTAARVRGSGAARLIDLRARAERLFHRIERTGALPFAPRLFGGFAFDSEPSPRRETDLGRAWAPFDDAVLVLPRLLFGCSGGRAIVAAFGPDASVASALVLAAQKALDPSMTHAPLPDIEQSVFDPTGDLAPKRPGDSLSWGDGGEHGYRDIVGRAVAAIGHHELKKVVLCRTRAATFSKDPDLLAAFARLEQRAPDCARFLFEQGGSTFVGATPERLIRVADLRAYTEALAGSLPRCAGESDADAASRLLASAKDRAEHALVVQAVHAALSPHCYAISSPPAPLVRSLVHLHHLATPIIALLSQRRHVLDLAASLHPTPALCGTPREAARAFLREHEPEPRGYYGGGIGYVDASGDGEIAVAIRSALVRGRSAWIYAGAGIVGASDPEKEYGETTAKERSMREALEAST